MSFKEEVKKELAEFKAWATEVNMQAHLAKSEMKSEARSAWMVAEQNAAKLEAKVEDLGDTVDQAMSSTLDQLKLSYQQLKDALKKS